MININNNFYLIVCVVVSLTFVIFSNQECIVDVNDKTHIQKNTPYPLFLDENQDFVRTSKVKSNRRNIVLSKNERMFLACTGYKNYLTVFGPEQSEVIATCVSGQSFNVNDIEYHIKDLRCKEWPISIQKKTGSCQNDKSLLEIGFPLKNNDLIPLIKICHDEYISQTLYSEFTLRPDAGDFHRDVSRPRYWNHKYMLKNAHKKYSNQEATLLKLLGEKSGQKYISRSEGRIFSRGHLAAKADFAFGPQQKATFFLTNTAPQWVGFNNGSWLDLEIDVRKFAEKSDRDFIIYTGTHGNLSLPNDEDEYVDLYLNNGTSTKRMPVPEYFWKVVRDPTSDYAIAFIGFNNIYLNETEAQMQQELFCETSMCDDVKFLRKKKYKPDRGYLICCNVNEFREFVDEFPAIESKGILIE